MPGTPQQNGVAERHNRTLMDMVRSMLSNSNLPKSLWMYALKTAVYFSPSFGGEKYVITFIDDFSRYGYVYFLHEKSQSVDSLEVYITEVERQLDRKVKIIRSDRGGEYYGKYDETGQCPVSSYFP